MRKLSEIKGEDALDVLAELIEPLAEFAQDKLFVDLVRRKEYLKACPYAIRSHKKALLRALAILEGVDPAEYNPSLIELPARLLEFFNDPELVLLFPSEQTVTSSGSASESTEEAEDK